MKIQYFTFLYSVFLILVATNFLPAQSPITGIIYEYDASGNRKKRMPDFGSSNRKAAPTEEQKNETAVVSNNMVASFTPNPTATGNFAVVVSKKDFASAQNFTTEKPHIFIYNPLGELIHQETTSYDNTVNINLSRHSRGIYLVKIQSGEEMLMHRMVYE